jgi:hypothetical protein
MRFRSKSKSINNSGRSNYQLKQALAPSRDEVLLKLDMHVFLLPLVVCEGVPPQALNEHPQAPNAVNAAIHLEQVLSPLAAMSFYSNSTCTASLCCWWSLKIYVVDAATRLKQVLAPGSYDNFCFNSTHLQQSTCSWPP